MPIFAPDTAVYADASRSKLNLLGIRRNGKKKSRRSSYGESIERPPYSWVVFLSPLALLKPTTLRRFIVFLHGL
jgi:hypothetical protein